MQEQSEPIDRPFPGARPQVPGARGGAGAETSRQLPLDARQQKSAQGWTATFTVRAEHVTVSKRVVVREEAVLRRRADERIARLEGEVRREVLRVDAHHTP